MVEVLIRPLVAAWLPIASELRYRVEKVHQPESGETVHSHVSFDHIRDIPNHFHRENADAREYRFGLTGQGYHLRLIPNFAH